MMAAACCTFSYEEGLCLLEPKRGGGGVKGVCVGGGARCRGRQSDLKSVGCVVSVRSSDLQKSALMPF